MDKMIRKADAFEILIHWTLAISFFILALSGFGFLFKVEQIGSLFGGFGQMKVIHNYAGIAFSGALFFTIFYYLPVSLTFSGDDIKWLTHLGGYFSKGPTILYQDKLNAGQKLFYLFMLTGGAAMAASGFVIWLMPGVRKWILLSHLVHNITFDLFMIAVPFHIYLATLANPGTLRVMIYGTVPVEWARRHHGKWAQKKGI